MVEILTSVVVVLAFLKMTLFTLLSQGFFTFFYVYPLPNKKSKIYFLPLGDPL